MDEGGTVSCSQLSPRSSRWFGPVKTCQEPQLTTQRGRTSAGPVSFVEDGFSA